MNVNLNEETYLEIPTKYFKLHKKKEKESEGKKIIGINICKMTEEYKMNQIDYINKIIKPYNINKTKQTNKKKIN